MIRVATLEDIPRILELGRMLHSQSDYSGYDYDDDKVSDLMVSLIDGAGVVFVSEIDGVVTGGFAGGVTEQWFSREKVGFDFSLFIEPTRRNGITAMKLIRAFHAWCKIKGAKRVRMGITTGISVEGTTRLYEACGMLPVGPLFEREF